MLLGSLGSDNSIDPEDVRNELRTELLMLNAALKQLDPNLDLSDAIRPLLADTGPAVAHVQLLSRQKQRMEKIRDGLLRQAEEKQSAARAESSACAMPAHPEPFGRHQEPQSSAPEETSSAPAAAFRDSNSHFASRPPVRLRGRPRGRRVQNGAETSGSDVCPGQAAQADVVGTSSPDDAPERSRRRGGRRGGAAGTSAEGGPSEVLINEVLPSWGPFKRYSDRIDQRTYNEASAVATWAFRAFQAQSGGPHKCTLRGLPYALLDGTPPPVAREKIMGFFCNRYLQFENIREAAMANDITRIQIGYYRNEQLIAAELALDGRRNNFISWAVAQLQSLGRKTSRGLTLARFLAIWGALAEEERKNITTTKPHSYFQSESASPG